MAVELGTRVRSWITIIEHRYTIDCFSSSQHCEEYVPHIAQANSSGGWLVECLCKRAQGSQTAESSPGQGRCILPIWPRDWLTVRNDYVKRWGCSQTGWRWLALRVRMKHVGRSADQDPSSSQRSRAMLVCGAERIARCRRQFSAHGRQRRFASIVRFGRRRVCRIARVVEL
jgi:hypothetical protein